MKKVKKSGGSTRYNKVEMDSPIPKAINVFELVILYPKNLRVIRIKLPIIVV